MDLEDPLVSLPGDCDADDGKVRWVSATGGFDSDGVGRAWPLAVEIEGDGVSDSFAFGVAVATGAVSFALGGRGVPPIPGRAFCLGICDS